MAQKVFTLLVDDLDGSELEDGTGRTVSFAWEGQNYSIDLSNENADKFRADIAAYIDAGRKAGKAPRASKRSQIGPAAQEIRDWARSNGYDVPDRGRIPASIREAFDAAR